LRVGAQDAALLMASPILRTGEGGRTEGV